MKTDIFKKLVWDFYKNNKREFPWRETTNPYNIMVSEIMLQQTQTSRVIGKYNQFIQELPTIQDLAHVSITKLLLLWQGLGYNRRALYLQRTSQVIANEWKNTFPKDPEILQTLPGIGPNTAASIIVFSYNIPLVFIETNIRRVFIHEFFQDQTEISDKEIIPLIEQTLDKKNPREWYYALMDYGSYLPKLITNPNRKSKHYSKQSKFEGSLRQVRGVILKTLLKHQKLSEQELFQLTTDNKDYYSKALDQLASEGFIIREVDTISFSGSRHEV